MKTLNKDNAQAKPGSTVEFSILIGRVSTEDDTRILETLSALRQQTGPHSYEVIIGDRICDAVSEQIDRDFPEVIRIEERSTTSLPVLRTLALEKSSGQYIIVTEDHCVPSLNWLENFAKAFTNAPEDTVAVGGCVENGVYETALDWATFFCEYSFFLNPVHEGVSEVLPGMNVAYKRDIFKTIEKDKLTNGFWETTLHPFLISQGKKLYSTNNIKLFHSKKFSLKLFLSQRFIYSRYYAGLRFKPEQKARRLIACGASIILPPLLFYRMIKQIRLKKRLGKELFQASPYLALFVVVWAIGEMWGYAFGSANALAQIE